LKISVGSDEKTVLTDFVVEELKRRGHAIVLSGPLKGEAMGWPDVGEKIGLEVSSGRADQGLSSVGLGLELLLPLTRFRESELLYAGTLKLRRARACGMMPTF
jgi:ribose 5-phosphate isomerase RpiB